ncbi:MAG TPA: DUF4013 domain-containing protein [Vicinamibacterales bacterium]|nr:DUF4013 domain-containing protein [Vicinamibacterales bacterium]
MSTPGAIDLRTPLGWRSAFRFPLQTRESRKEILIGAALLLLPVVGWLLNMGHRIQMVHNMQTGAPAWPAWRNYGRLLKHGTVTFLGMLQYHLPAFIVGAFAWRLRSTALEIVAAVLWILATIAVPGFMSHYCLRFDPAEVFNPIKALRRVAQGGRAYWDAWAIALAALAISFLGLLLVGVGFLVTSVWFWQVAGFGFASVFSKRFDLTAAARP